MGTFVHPPLAKHNTLLDIDDIEEANLSEFDGDKVSSPAKTMESLPKSRHKRQISDGSSLPTTPIRVPTTRGTIDGEMKTVQIRIGAPSDESPEGDLTPQRGGENDMRLKEPICLVNDGKIKPKDGEIQKEEL